MTILAGIYNPVSNSWRVVQAVAPDGMAWTAVRIGNRGAWATRGELFSACASEGLLLTRSGAIVADKPLCGEGDEL